MSTDYYLNCETHNVAVHLTDNKLNPPINKRGLKIFLCWHYGCKVVLEHDNSVEFENVKRFEEWFKNYEKEERLDNDRLT